MNRGMIKSSREPSARPAQGLIEYTLPENPPAVCKYIGLQNRAVLEAEANRGRVMCNRRPNQLSSLAGDITIHSIGDFIRD